MEKFKELSLEDLQETTGGLGFWATIGVGLIIGAGIAIIDDWDNFKAGLRGQPEIK